VSILISTMAFIYGLVFGSLSNALAYRIPTGESLMTRSHCTNCNSMVKAWMNIPVLSWLVLIGKCHTCKSRISIQYPLIELLTATVFALIALRIYGMNLGFVPGLLATIGLCFFAFIGVVLSIIDAKTKTLPTKTIYVGLAVVIPFLTAASLLAGNPSQLLWMLLGSAATFAFYGLIWLIRPDALGFGDVRLALLTGAALGWISFGSAIVAILLTYFIMSAVFAPLMILKKVSKKTVVPMGPWIIFGSTLSIFFGDILTKTIIGG
jgi:leader peptidase (prepilin peptidase)/N-methyltransferase